MYYAALVVTVASNVLYHIAQKLMPVAVSPALALFVTYLSAAAACVLLLPLFPLSAPIGASLRQLNLSSFVLALAIVGLELGFLMAYRAGWSITTAGLISNTAVAVLLVPVGVGFFRERLTLVNAVGIAVCLVGLVLVNWKR
jgi:drug/metabolite transporter (DMT)-like permease